MIDTSLDSRAAVCQCVIQTALEGVSVMLGRRALAVFVLLACLFGLGTWTGYAEAMYPVPDLENHQQCVSIGGYSGEMYFYGAFESNCGSVCGPLVDVTINGEYWEIIVQGGFGGGCGACAVDLLDQAITAASGTYENCMGSGTGGCLSSNPWC